MFEDQIKDKFVTRESDTTRYFTAANMISIARIVLTVPAVWLFIADRWAWGLAVLGICVLSDWLDGFIARKTHEVSDFGKFIDPLADKVVAAAMILLMILRMDFPLWFLLLLIVRDLSIFLSKNMLYRRYHIVCGANVIGKIFIFVLTVAGVFWILEFYLDVNLYAVWILYLSTLLMLISWVVYMIQTAKIIRKRKAEDPPTPRLRRAGSRQ